MIKIKRVYEPATPDDGERYLVERLWPRGIKNVPIMVLVVIARVSPYG